MAINDFYGMESQQYRAPNIIGNAKAARQRSQQGDSPQMNMSGLMNTESATAGVLNQMSIESENLRKQQALNDRMKYQNQMLQSQVNGLGNAENIVNSNANQGNNNVNVSGSSIKSGSLFDATKKINDQGLKYSMKRGKGCTDCSAFTQNVYKDTFGIDIGGWTGSQKNAGVSVKPSERKYGDLVFFNTDGGKRTGGISHVGYDNGDGTFTHFSSSNGGGIRTTPYKGYYPVVDTRRVI